VVNTWNAPVSISLERGTLSEDAAPYTRIPSGSGQAITYAPLPGGQLPSGQVGIVFLATGTEDAGGGYDPCPPGMPVAVVAGTPQSEVTIPGGIGDAFHLKVSAPVVAYDIYPFGGGPAVTASATLLLPTPAWDTNYMAVIAYPYNGAGNPSVTVVAQEDGTTFTISPTVNIEGFGGGFGGAFDGGPKGVPITYALSKGQYLQFSQTTDLSGSPIQSNKPIGVWGGSACMFIAGGGCDTAHQELPPIKSLGSEYVAVRYRNRVATLDEAPPWRIAAVKDGTTLTYEPSAPAGAPTTLASGQLVEFNAAGPFVVRSQDDQHPFYMSAHMTGCMAIGGYDSPEGCAGDPEFVNVIPPKQYLSSYVFFTDPTYPETDLVFVRAKTKAGFKDVTLDCGGVLSGWQPVGTSGDYEYVRIDLVRHNFEKQGNCDNGRHEVTSEGPFGLTVWGWGTKESGGDVLPDGGHLPGFFSQAVSYAYPAGAGVSPINTIVYPPAPK
jgi:hypothetical protein